MPQIAGEGGSVGPRLTGVDAALTARSVGINRLPSKVIAEGLQRPRRNKIRRSRDWPGRARGRSNRGRLPQTATAEAASLRKSDIRAQVIEGLEHARWNFNLCKQQILGCWPCVVSDGNSIALLS
jgi:hypothetical protein